ncbi:hypothetical protein V8G54_017401 [Vigna mungo]|uniref:Uncharacterized protein n=1 Tax=Vigna mungo TaxID=3915 RepID=A0AAQ3S214_VIGMU
MWDFQHTFFTSRYRHLVRDCRNWMIQYRSDIRVDADIANQLHTTYPNYNSNSCKQWVYLGPKPSIRHLQMKQRPKVVYSSQISSFQWINTQWVKEDSAHQLLCLTLLSRKCSCSPGHGISPIVI